VTDAQAIAPPVVCRTCGTALAGPYCHACGQASPAARRPLRAALTGQTGRMLYTIRTLLTRPGELARQVDEGRDLHAVRPLTLLLNLIPVFFLLGGNVGGFGARMFVASDGTHRLQAAIEQRSAREQVGVEVFEERLEQRFRAVYSMLVVVQAAAYALALAVFERRRRKAWLVHAAAAIHYLCFSVVVSGLLFAAARLAGVPVTGHPWIALPGLLLNVIYMALTLRRVYGERVPPALAKAVGLLVFGTVVSIVLTGTAMAVALWTT
jgi:hypothetical protein